MEKKEGGGLEPGNSNDSGKTQQQQTRTNVKLLKRSHAIKESNSPPPDILNFSIEHENAPEVEHINNNIVDISKNDAPLTGENSVDTNWPDTIAIEDNTDQTSRAQSLEKFIRTFLHKSSKDRQFLMKLESDLIEFSINQKKTSISFGIMSSYERMLVHRVAQYFSMEHKVDSTGNEVIVTKGKHPRLPNTKFRQFLRDGSPSIKEPKKSILKRDSASFEDTVTFKSSDRHGADALRRSKSYEEREEEYEKARKRIFHQGKDSQDGTREWVEHMWPPEHENFLNVQPQQSGTTGEEQYPNKPMTVDQQSLSHLRPPRLMKGESYETKDTLKANSLRSSISKSYSFGGYDQNANARVLTKQDSGSSMSSRVSPLSSGYKSQSLRSDTISATPSPSVTPHFTITLPNQTGAASEEEQPTVLWAVTKIESVPAGSVLINPQTGEPYTNEDGSIYHFDPSNPPNLEGSGPRHKHYKTQPEINGPHHECDVESAAIRQMPQSSHSHGAPTDNHQSFSYRPELSHPGSHLRHPQQPPIDLSEDSSDIAFVLRRQLREFYQVLYDSRPPIGGSHAPQPNAEQDGNTPDMCNFMMGLSLNDRGRTTEPARRHQTYCPSAHLPVPQNIVNPPMTTATIVPRSNDWPTFYRIVYNTGGVGLPMMFNTPPPSLAQPPPFPPFRYSHSVVPNTPSVSGPELNFPLPPSHALYQFPPNVQVGAPTPSFFPSMAAGRVPTNGMMGYVPMPSAPSSLFHQHLPLPNTPHTPQSSNTHFPVYTNHAPPVQSFPQYQAGSLPRQPIIRASRMQQGPWS